MNDWHAGLLVGGLIGYVAGAWFTGFVVMLYEARAMSRKHRAGHCEHDNRSR